MYVCVLPRLSRPRAGSLHSASRLIISHYSPSLSSPSLSVPHRLTLYLSIGLCLCTCVYGCAFVYTCFRGGYRIRETGFVLVARQARALRARPRGVWGHAPPETFWISDLLRSLLVQSGGEILGRRTCHARTRSSVGDRTASYFRSGNFTFCTRPSIITLTAPVARRPLSSPLFLLCLQPSISSALKNNWYCRLEGGFVRTQRTPPGSAPVFHFPRDPRRKQHCLDAAGLNRETRHDCFGNTLAMMAATTKFSGKYCFC